MISKSIYLARIIGHSLHNIAISIVWQELRFAIAGRKWGRSGFGFRVWAGVGVGVLGFEFWSWGFGVGVLGMGSGMWFLERVLDRPLDRPLDRFLNKVWVWG